MSCDIIDASGPHGRVAKNIVLELGRWLDQDRFDINFANFAVRTPSGVRSPDVVVDAMSPRRDLSTSTPVVIAEVLTPSTAGKDFAEKLEGYTAVDTLQTYLIWSRYEPRAWVWARGADRSWPKHPFELPGRNGTVALGGLGVELPIAAIFRGIPDAPTIE